MPRRGVVIVGAGMAGRTIGLWLARERNVWWFDAGYDHRATPASAGVIYPSWLGTMTPDELHAGLRVLERFYPVNAWKNLKHPAWQVPAPVVMTHPEVEVDRRVVTRVDPDGTVTLDDGSLVVDKHVILCAGSWTNQLWYTDPSHRVVGKAGTACRYVGDWAEPTLVPWAPYKQLMVFQESPGVIWGGDGTSILAHHYTYESVARTDLRVRAMVGSALPLMDFQTGYRPYRSRLGPWCEQIGPRVWVATGGNKSTTILSALWALQLQHSLRKEG